MSPLRNPTSLFVFALCREYLRQRKTGMASMMMKTLNSILRRERTGTEAKWVSETKTEFIRVCVCVLNNNTVLIRLIQILNTTTASLWVYLDADELSARYHQPESTSFFLPSLYNIVGYSKLLSFGGKNELVCCVTFQNRGSSRRRTEPVNMEDQDKPYVCDSKGKGNATLFPSCTLLRSAQLQSQSRDAVFF